MTTTDPELAPATDAGERLKVMLEAELAKLPNDSAEYLLRVHTLHVNEVMLSRAEVRYKELKEGW